MGARRCFVSGLPRSHFETSRAASFSWSRPRLRRARTTASPSGQGRRRRSPPHLGRGVSASAKSVRRVGRATRAASERPAPSNRAFPSALRAGQPSPGARDGADARPGGAPFRGSRAGAPPQAARERRGRGRAVELLGPFVAGRPDAEFPVRDAAGVGVKPVCAAWVAPRRRLAARSCSPMVRRLRVGSPPREQWWPATGKS